MQALFVVEPFPVFPARAGMIPVLPRLEWPGEGIPRESGDDPPLAKNFIIPCRIPRESGDDPDWEEKHYATPEYSPRERG